MPILATVAFGILACLGSLGPRPLAPDMAQPQPAASPALGEPMRVLLSTVVDHPDQLGGWLVQLPPTRVSRVFSPTLVELREARERSPYRFYHWTHDRLLALLPPGARVSAGDRLLVSGRVMTVAGAAQAGVLAGVGPDSLEDRRHDVLLVADSLTTVDGVSLTAPR